MKNNDQEWNDKKQQILNDIMRKCFIDGYVCEGIERLERVKLHQEACSAADEYIKYREGK